MNELLKDPVRLARRLKDLETRWQHLLREARRCERYPGLLDNEAYLWWFVWQSKHVRTRAASIEALLSSALEQERPNTPAWQVTRRLRDMVRGKKEVLEEVLAEIEREQRKDAFQVLGEEEEEAEE